MGHHDKEGGFWKGTLVGAAVGTVLALLFAPKSGKETQEDLKRRARSMKEDVERLLGELQSDLSGRIDNLKDAAKELGGEAREESQGLISRAENLKKELRTSASNLAGLGTEAKETAVSDAKRLLDEGSEVMKELERLTRKLVSSAKDKVKSGGSKEGGDGES